MTCVRPGCGREFTSHPKARGQKFCSNDCRYKWHHQENPVGVERHRAACNRYWHKADGGYIRRRKRDLARERQEILKLLKEAR